jgi:hypothetical protein
MYKFVCIYLCVNVSIFVCVLVSNKVHLNQPIQNFVCTVYRPTEERPPHTQPHMCHTKHNAIQTHTNALNRLIYHSIMLFGSDGI